MASTRVDEYRIFLYGKQNETENKMGSILCYLAGDFVARLSFYRPESVPLNRIFSSDKIGLNLPIDQFTNIVDVLRNESPLYITFTGSTRKGYLCTSVEPAGDYD